LKCDQSEASDDAGNTAYNVKNKKARAGDSNTGSKL
jgi:hypothetical protein